jgi:hypothetical protein
VKVIQSCFSEAESIDRLRRVSYLRATKEDRVQSDSDHDETDPAGSKTDVDGSRQVQGIQKIFSVFGKKSSSENFPSPSTESSKLDDFAARMSSDHPSVRSSDHPIIRSSDLTENPLKEGWLEFQTVEDESKVSLKLETTRSWKANEDHMVGIKQGIPTEGDAQYS